MLYILKDLFCTRWPKRIAIFVCSLASVLCFLFGFWAQKHFVDLLSPATVAAPWMQSFVFVVGAFVGLVLAQCFSALCKFLCLQESNWAQLRLSNKIYDHTLNLQWQARLQKTVGEMVSLYAQDVAATCALLDDVLPNLLSSAISLVLAPFAISYFVNVPLVLPLLVSLISVGLCFWLSQRQGRFFSLTKVYAEQRLSVVNEWLQNIRSLRILCWVTAFEQKIFRARKVETANRLKMVTNGSTMNSIAQVAPFLINVAAIVAYLQASQTQPSAGDIFSMLWVFGVFLVRPIRMFPWALVVAQDALTSAKRLERFFALPVESGRLPVQFMSSLTHDAQAVELGSSSTIPAVINVTNLCLEIENKKILSHVSFCLDQGELLGIVGPVGAGKSSLLHSLILDTPCSFENYGLWGRPIGYAGGLKTFSEIRRNFVLVPQEAFVMNGSLAENVLFRYIDEQESLEREFAIARVCLNDAAFPVDVLHGSSALPPKTGDSAPGISLQTQIGERGVNISGGQRQRINLARARYAHQVYVSNIADTRLQEGFAGAEHGLTQRQIVLLDDCFSALDAATEQIVRDRLLLGAWRNCARILVTHRLSILPFCHKVLFLVDGKCQGLGTYDELMKSNTVFREFVFSAQSQHFPSDH